MLCLGLSSCGDNSLIDRDINLRTSTSSQWALPLATANASIAEILYGNKVADGVLITQGDSLILRLEYQDLLDIPSLEALLPTKDISASESGRVPDEGFPMSLTIPAGAVAQLANLFPTSEEAIKIEFPDEIKSISELKLSLSLALSITSSPISADISITFPTLANAEGKTYEIKSSVTAGKPSKIEIPSGILRLTTPSEGNQLTLPYRITVKPTATSAVSITQGGGISYTLAVRDIVLERFSGQISEIVSDIKGQEDKWDFSVWKDLQGITFQGGKLSFIAHASNMLGKVSFAPNAHFLDGKTELSSWSGERKTLAIDAPLGTGTTSVDYHSDELQKLLSSIQGRGIRFSGDVTFGGGSPITLDRTSSLSVDLNLEQPLVFALAGMNIEIPFTTPSLERFGNVEDSFEQVDLILKSSSTAPLTLECKSIDVLGADGKLLNEEASIPFTGKLLGDQDSASEIRLTLSKAQLALLKRAKSLSIRASISTTSDKPTQLLSSHRICLQLSTALNAINP